MLPQRTVLVVEDEPLILLGASDMLESAGFQVREAGNADQAMHILEVDRAIDILFTDVDMPGSMNGMGLAFEVSKRWPRICIAITSGRWPAAREEIPAGAVFLDKPYLASSLVKALQGLTG
ncbi:response regulator [Novosphingobium sp. 9]|uniref:response regulator n=1 Tax=Novosphingobium sp. 9 TaxID=2025349 RepID=UPI0021B5146C|nr:response regulator [Novosphingobium sp. 9]